MAISRFDISPIRQELTRGTTVLVPNHRSSDAILTAFGQEQSPRCAAWKAPKVYAIDIWLTRLWQTLTESGKAPYAGLRLLTRNEEQYLWLSVLEASGDELPLLNLAETALALSRSYQLCQQWFTDPHSATVFSQHSGNVDSNAFRRWSVEFEQLCQRHKLVNLSAASKLLIENEASQLFGIPDKLLLVNFHQPPPLYVKLFAALEKLTDLQKIICNNDEHNASIEQQCFPDLNIEAQSCVKWALKHRRQSPDAHIAIVAQDTEQYRELLLNGFSQLAEEPSDKQADNLFGDNYPFNVSSTREKLSNSRLVHTALILLAFNTGKISSQDFCLTLQSPSLLGFDSELEARIQLEWKLRKNGQIQCRLADVRGLMNQQETRWHCPQLGDALLRFDQLKRQTGELAEAMDWAILFETQLKLLGWPGELKQAREQTIYHQFLACLRQFFQASSLLGKLNCQQALAKLRLIVSHTSVTAGFNPQRNISLLSVDEAIGLHFNHLWVLGMTDHNWPLDAAPDPFLPVSMQQSLGMPAASSEQQLSYASSALQQLVHATSDKVLFSYPASEGDQVFRVSRLINGYKVAANEERASLSTSGLSQRIKMEVVDDCKPLPLLVNENIQGGSSLLNNQSSCPFKAFASNRLAAAALPDFEFGLSNVTRGTALHAALEYFWRQLGSQEKLLQTSESQLDELLDAGIDYASNQLKKRFPETMSPAFTRIEQKRMKGLLLANVNLERQRGPFQVFATEKKVVWSHEKLKLKLSIDRIDKLENDSLALIDYKTARQLDFSWFDERPKDLQLPLYFLALAENTDNRISALFISQINAEGTKFSGVYEEKSLIGSFANECLPKNSGLSWPDLQNLWSQTIADIASEFERGICSVTPFNPAFSCQYCDLPALCRIGESKQLQMLKKGAHE